MEKEERKHIRKGEEGRTRQKEVGPRE